MKYTLMASISTFDTTIIVVADSSKFSFIGSIPEVMFIEVPPSSKILEGYRQLTPSGPLILTDEMQAVLAEDDKPKKRGKRVPRRTRNGLR